jgi:hypothetical protein
MQGAAWALQACWLQQRQQQVELWIRGEGCSACNHKECCCSSSWHLQQVPLLPEVLVV